MRTITTIFILTFFLTTLCKHIHAADYAPKNEEAVVKKKMHQEVLNELLREAAQVGNVVRVFELIDQGAQINSHSPRTNDTLVAKLFNTGLIDKSTIAQLIEKGADIKKKHSTQGTTLLRTLMNGNATPYLDAFLCLVFDFDLNLACRDNKKNTLFHHAAMIKSQFWTAILLGLFRVKYTPLAIRIFLDAENIEGKTAYQIANDTKCEAIITLIQQEIIRLTKEINLGDMATQQEEKVKTGKTKAEGKLLLEELNQLETNGDVFSQASLQCIKRARRKSQPIPMQRVKKESDQ